MYSFCSRVRYSETGFSQHMNMYSIINYFQDCSTFHSEDVGLGIDKLFINKKAWMISAWQIKVKCFPKLYENITIATWPYGFKGIYAYRNFFIYNDLNEILVAANSIWVYIDLFSGHPVKITDSDVEAYGLGEKYSMEYAERKIPIPNQLSELSPLKITPSCIDTNNHVNNSIYIRMAEEYLPEDFDIKQMRVDYRNSAVSGDTIHPFINIENETAIICLSNDKNVPYTIIEFT